MSDITINGHPLPQRLIELIDSGSWGSAKYAANLNVLPIEDKDDLTFLDLRGIAENTRELQAMWERGEGTLFSLSNGQTSSAGTLDIAQAVVIAATYGQEVLCLDYSMGTVPRVVSTHYQSGKVTWTEISTSFDQFLTQIDLIKS